MDQNTHCVYARTHKGIILDQSSPNSVCPSLGIPTSKPMEYDLKIPFHDAAAPFLFNEILLFFFF